MIKNVEYFLKFEELIEAKQDANENFVLLVAEQTSVDFTKSKNFLSTFHAAIFPQVVYEDNHYEEGIVVLTLSENAEVKLIENIKEPQFTCMDYESIIVFFDALSSNIDRFLEELFVYSDVTSSVLGGGAGKISLVQEAVIFDNHKMYENAAIIIGTSVRSGIGVKHGWQEMSETFVVTSADGNVVKEINYQNALDFYISRLDTQETITQENFFEIAKSHPLGVQTLSQEIVVRDPLSFSDDGIFMAASISENTVVSILKGDSASLLQAASEATQEAIYRIRHIPKNLLVVDCISRALFLEEDFVKELKSIHSFAPHANMFGALTLGEVANNSNKYIEVFNKTCVIGAIE